MAEDNLDNPIAPAAENGRSPAKSQEGTVLPQITRRNFLGMAGAGVVGATLGAKLIPQALSQKRASGARIIRNAASTTTLTFWNSYTASDRPFVEAIVARYNSTQSKVHIKMSIMPNDVLQEKLLISLGQARGRTFRPRQGGLCKPYRSSPPPG